MQTRAEEEEEEEKGERRRGRKRECVSGSQWLGDMMNRPWLQTALARLKGEVRWDNGMFMS